MEDEGSILTEDSSRARRRIINKAKSFHCRYTAVGVFVLCRMFQEAWGAEAAKKQAEFNEYLEVILFCNLKQ